MSLRLVLTACLCLFALAARAEVVAPNESLLQLSPELSRAGTEPSASTLTFTRDPSQEVKDELPPMPTIDLTTPPDDLWQRVRNGFGMPDLHSPLVAERQAWYLNRPELLKRVFERSRKYLHHIVEETEKRGMPTELALLPIVESSFNPLARSPARALGMWQFIPSTGRSYNLKQNYWMDQRRDIIASTSAALEYLQNIYEMHGDWHLALASYNWGEHAVARAVGKNQAKGLPTDYAHLTMPAETRYYVPKLQAIKNIIAQPELFGFRLDQIPNKPYFGTVDIGNDMDISLAAKLAETPIEEFIALNPAYHRPVVPGDNRSPLVVPADKVDAFRRNLERYEAEDKPLSSWQTYTLKQGERLDSVAARFGLTTARLKQLNGITPRVKVGPGFSLLVPGKGAQAAAEAVAGKLPQAQADAPAPKRGKKAAKGAKPGKGAKTPKKSASAKPVGKPRPAAKGKKR
ncbi:transglycosylase SLT domain-containing protein [Sulfurisoma sediminicola]|uniref:Membrane-bound lytic murein transglycosylase D n=1 Tax=Sulfurisoma sediminicola TaxID=1381557 RepID=A0A497XF62_9PROT|nr:transglycosylase SLT domain-containing protein [Sulfurisoma sediminicola]RLJ65354.1 membrane-bound lytic murein transglycosylase D [Sulfurisoma sediminicola]